MKTIGDSDITDIPSVEKRQSPASVPLISAGNTYRLVGTRAKRVHSRRARTRPSFKLKRERDGDDRIIVDVRTGIFGHGTDDQAALRDFMKAARDHLAVLEQEDTLPPAVQAQREYLRARVRA
jgi:hypothetical protein